MKSSIPFRYIHFIFQRLFSRNFNEKKRTPKRKHFCSAMPSILITISAYCIDMDNRKKKKMKIYKTDDTIYNLRK